MFSLKPKYKMWRVFNQPIGTFVYFFVRCENFALYHNKRLLRADPCCRSVIKEFAHAFSCAYIELWMHLRSLESTQKARVALGCATSYSYAFFVFSKLPACTNKFLINKWKNGLWLVCEYNIITTGTNTAPCGATWKF